MISLDTEAAEEEQLESLEKDTLAGQMREVNEACIKLKEAIIIEIKKVIDWIVAKEDFHD